MGEKKKKRSSFVFHKPERVPAIYCKNANSNRITKLGRERAWGVRVPTSNIRQLKVTHSISPGGIALGPTRRIRPIPSRSRRAAQTRSDVSCICRRHRQRHQHRSRQRTVLRDSQAAVSCILLGKGQDCVSAEPQRTYDGQFSLLARQEVHFQRLYCVPLVQRRFLIEVQICHR